MVNGSQHDTEWDKGHKNGRESMKAAILHELDQDLRAADSDEARQALEDAITHVRSV
jgi:hypothetical protein